MATVTGIRQQVKRLDRYSIYVDGHYQLSLHIDQLLERGLKVGDELSADELDNLSEASEAGKALAKAHNYLSYRLRSTAEMTTHLRRKGYEDEVITTVIDGLIEAELLNDRRFAESWLADRRLLGHSATRLRQELRQKQIATELIDELMSEISADDEIGSIVQLIENRQLRRRYPDQEKLIRHLAGKGFRYGTIKAALERLTAN